MRFKNLNKKSMKLLLLILIFSLFILMSCQIFENPAKNIALNSLFTDHMVLQQKQNIPIWGTAEPGGEVTISLNSQQKSVIVDTNGKWTIQMDPISAGGPYILTITGEDTISINDVMIGEVWVCSGQSNMEMSLAQVNNFQEEIKNANYKNIRLLMVDKEMATTPQEKLLSSGWKECSSETIPEFSAVAYFFGRKLHKDLNVPVGLIETAWGGTVVEAWTSAKSLKNINEFVEEIDILNNNNNTEEKIEVSYNDVQSKWIDEVNGRLNDAGILKRRYSTYGYDTKEWKTLDVPNTWEEQNIMFDGVMWVKKNIVIPEDWQGDELTLNLGPINDFDITWFNGELVGSTPGVGMFRSYKLSKELVKDGINEITCLILDIGNNGGIYGKPENTVLVNSDSATISLAGKWKYKKDHFDPSILSVPPSWPGISEQNRPTVLYNGMISPLLPYGIRGAIWYQGESNADRSIQYRKLFKTLITDWREVWGQGDFPFLFVQLANFMSIIKEPSNEPWAKLREAQTMALDLPNTGMAVSIDIGDEKDIHPKNKQDVGMRLAINALVKVYGNDIPYSGPIYKSMKIEGNKILLQFTNTNKGLKIKDSKKLKGFAIAGEDKKFVWANAKIEGTEIIVSSSKVKNPVAVRYAWANNPICNLYNGADLPASPFRTDSW